MPGVFSIAKEDGSWLKQQQNFPSSRRQQRPPLGGPPCWSLWRHSIRKWTACSTSSRAASGDCRSVAVSSRPNRCCATRLRSEVSAPVVDVVEKEREYQVSAELPGLEEKDVEVSVADDMLTIKGEKKEEKEEKAKNYYLSERRYGAFQRSFRLPPGVDSAKIEANFQKGVLTVTLPKTPEAQKKEKKIEIKTK